MVIFFFFYNAKRKKCMSMEVFDFLSILSFSTFCFLFTDLILYGAPILNSCFSKTWNIKKRLNGLTIRRKKLKREIKKWGGRKESIIYYYIYRQFLWRQWQISNWLNGSQLYFILFLLDWKGQEFHTTKKLYT